MVPLSWPSKADGGSDLAYVTELELLGSSEHNSQVPTTWFLVVINGSDRRVVMGRWFGGAIVVLPLLFVCLSIRLDPGFLLIKHCSFRAACQCVRYRSRCTSDLFVLDLGDHLVRSDRSTNSTPSNPETVHYIKLHAITSIKPS